MDERLSQPWRKGILKWSFEVHQHKLHLKRILKNVSGEIVFAVINLFQAQIQKPASRSTIMRALVFLAKFAVIIAKYLKQEVHDNLTFVWMNIAPVPSL